MCRETTTRIVGAALDVMDRKLDRLSEDLLCLIELGVLGSEETREFTALLGEAWVLLARARVPQRTHRLVKPVSLQELSEVVNLLTKDIDLAYRQLSFAA